MGLLYFQTTDNKKTDSKRKFIGTAEASWKEQMEGDI